MTKFWTIAGIFVLTAVLAVGWGLIAAAVFPPGFASVATFLGGVAIGYVGGTLVLLKLLDA